MRIHGCRVPRTTRRYHPIQIAVTIRGNEYHEQSDDTTSTTTSTVWGDDSSSCHNDDDDDEPKNTTGVSTTIYQKELRTNPTGLSLPTETDEHSHCRMFTATPMMIYIYITCVVTVYPIKRDSSVVCGS